MATKKKMLQAAAGNAGGAGPDVEDVFSTYLYEGTGAAQTITNGIDLDGEGGLVWLKERTSVGSLGWHSLFDTERGVSKYLSSNTTNAEASSAGVTAFNSNGFTLGSTNLVNQNTGDFASWTFRKAPKFFTCLTYTGTGTAQNISHDLGSDVGFLLIKRTDSTGNWRCWHRGLPGTGSNMEFNQTGAYETATTIFNGTDPTSTQFSVGTSTNVNASGSTYVAYLFAHNDGDGEFGPDGDADIIKCGSVPANAETTEDLGWEPQWLLIKRTDSTGDWQLFDNMRGLFVGGPDNARLRPNLSNAEDGSNSTFLQPRSTGFYINTNYFGGGPYIYIAIRRGPLAPPESGTEVFEVATRTTGLPSFEAPFAVDMGLVRKGITASGGVYNASRLTGTNFLYTNGTDAEANDNGFVWDFMDGWANDGGTSSEVISWMWKRAPNFFDVVAYTGDGTAGRTVSHNLGVAPEMIWAKQRSSSGNSWRVWYEGVPSGKMLRLNGTDGVFNETSRISDADATTFTLNDGTSGINGSGSTYIAYLFASLDGVSKVGSYTGNGSFQNIDCGFTTGARFVLIKRTDGAGSWHVFDTARGIVAGNDPVLLLNSTAAEDAFGSSDNVDPYPAGFGVWAGGYTLNNSGENYIFYAIA